MSGPTFEVGQLVQHRHYGYRGAIAGVDSCCLGSTSWYFSNQTLPTREQSWYHIVVHGARHVAYVAEEDLQKDLGGEQVLHPLSKYIFPFFQNGKYSAWHCRSFSSPVLREASPVPRGASSVPRGASSSSPLATTPEIATTGSKPLQQKKPNWKSRLWRRGAGANPTSSNPSQSTPRRSALGSARPALAPALAPTLAKSAWEKSAWEKTGLWRVLSVQPQTKATRR